MDPFGPFFRVKIQSAGQKVNPPFRTDPPRCGCIRGGVGPSTPAPKGFPGGCSSGREVVGLVLPSFRTSGVYPTPIPSRLEFSSPRVNFIANPNITSNDTRWSRTYDPFQSHVESRLVAFSNGPSLLPVSSPLSTGSDRGSPRRTKGGIGRRGNGQDRDGRSLTHPPVTQASTTRSSACDPFDSVVGPDLVP